MGSPSTRLRWAVARFLTTSVLTGLRWLHPAHHHRRGMLAPQFAELSVANLGKVHERSIESDFLLIVLRALLVQRPDLR
jgi:hypothetical protein